MKKVVVAVTSTLLIVLVGVIGWRALVGESTVEVLPDTGAAEVKVPEFPTLDVRGGTTSGLALTGVVRDSAGNAVPGAEVFLAASGQQSLTSVRCGTCQEPLLGCRARESTPLLESLLSQHKGELTPGASTRTDAEGKFRFESLAGISFTVWARAKGLGEGVKERAAPGDPVELYLPALRSIAGRLRTEEGKPVAGHLFVTSRRLAHVVEAQADAEGRFQVTGLGEGPFFVLASAPGLLPASLEQVEAGPDPVAITLLAPRALEVRLVFQGKPIDGTVRLTGDHLSREQVAKGGMTTLERLYPGRVMASAVAGELSSPPVSVSLDSLLTRVTLNLDKGGTLAVSVVDEADQPVTDPTVELLTATGELISKRKLGTGELGVLGPLGAGDYLLRATADGYGTGTVPAAVKAGETRVDVTLTRGIVIAGKVIDEYGRPAPGVSVLITPTGDNVIADPEGKFRAPVPSPGLYTLHAHHSDWGGGDLKVTAPKSDVVLQLEAKAGAAVTVMADGRRVEGASVILFHSMGNFRSDRPSGADGVVMMRGLPPDSYTLVATHPEFLPSERQPLKLEDGQLLKVTAELKPGGAVKGQVVDNLGLPVAGAQVGVVPRGAEPDTTDANGSFSISPLRPKGQYAIRVTQKGIEQVDRVVAIAGGDPVKVTVRRMPVFKGRVLGDGQPLKHFRVDEHEVTSADGRFELPLPATEDRVIVAIESPGYEPFVGDRPRNPDLGDFDLRRAPQISGVVKDGTGGVVADAVVGCDTCEQSVLSGPDGRFQLSKPPYQREFNVLGRKGRRTAQRTVTSDATTGIELVLRPGVQVSGLAFLPTGRPAAGVEIAAVSSDRADTTTVVTNEDGTWATELPPGSYSFMLGLPEYAQLAVDPPATIVEVRGDSQRIDFGPVPGTSQLGVHLAPAQGYAMWLVKGDVRAVGNPPLELLHAAWAQLVYQPRQDRVTFSGLSPGHYTLVWASFHAATEGGPVLIPVDVPAQADVSIVR